MSQFENIFKVTDAGIELNKQELIKELVKFKAASNENLKLKVEDVVDNTVGKEESVDTTDFNSVLSSQATKWKTYLKSIGSTAEMFLTRYPNHKYKVFIEEVLKNEKKEQ